MIAFVFPGQGSEEAEMGLALARADAEAMALLDHASRITGVHVVRALERGGRALTGTDVLQPVLTAVSLAAARALERRGVRPSLVAGHSLGELVAACHAARLDAAEAIELAALRGSLMAKACDARPGVMAALRGSRDRFELIGDAVIAAENAPDETVISGSAEDVDAMLSRARGVKLRVSGAWHSEHMRSAVEPFRARAAALFADTPLEMPLVAHDPRPTTADTLADAIVRPVRFVWILTELERLGVRDLVVMAPSRVVRSLVRRTLGTRVSLHGADDPASLDAIATALVTTYSTTEQP